MKNLIFILIFSVNAMFAQQKNTIMVAGEATKTIAIEKYVVNVEFREIMADTYQNIKPQNLEELKKEYASMLSKIGVDFSQFQENALYRVTSGQYNTTTYYYYTANSIEEVQKIISLRMKGVTSTWVDIVSKEKTTMEIAALNKKAIENAKDKANAIAKNIDKKIGEILNIEDVNYQQHLYYPSKPTESLKYYIKVTFLLE
ncbi:SIMPL domain-containing protein [Aquimarina sp. 2201CG14-23]|uniref:SIMPL domain-containing protein n=1 Tax=Aquimarina mycalae TaxID=3040073 RepID=UPI0024780A99|nr:SIMPL domain-containing protein [Aquimarina sp. 2201CG14-23]MDH7446254.1 SIMPL domain-containing protein [Aquimarina sp. 2201CG14-23]